MNQYKHEIPLMGGAQNSDIVRIGNTVRRAQGPNAAFVHELLSFLETRNFYQAPRFVGIDDKNREILSFFEGESLPGSNYKLNDNQLQNVAKLVRNFHDVTAGSALAAGHEIVAHGELGPYNTIFNGDNPVGLIDWDDAAPGTRLRDFAYAVDSYTTILDRNIPALEQARRIKIMCEAYGWARPIDLLAEIQAEYQRGLVNHQRKGNLKAITVFEDINLWLEARTFELTKLL